MTNPADPMPLVTYDLCKEGDSNLSCVKINRYQHSNSLAAKILGILTYAPLGKSEDSPLKRRCIIVMHKATEKSMLVTAVDRAFIEAMPSKEFPKEDRKTLSNPGDEFLLYIDPITNKTRFTGEAGMGSFCLEHPVKDSIDLNDLQCISKYISLKERFPLSLKGAASMDEQALKITALCANAEFMNELQINALYEALLKGIESLKSHAEAPDITKKLDFLKQHISILNDCFSGSVLSEKKVLRKGSLVEFF
jgi:hypothetical protein